MKSAPDDTLDASALRQLLDLESIRRVKARYVRFLDTKEWVKLRDLFTDDAVIELPELGGPALGVNEWLAGLQGRLAQAVTVHHAALPDIEFHSSTEARGLWAMSDTVRVATESGRRTVQGAGYYAESYRKVDGRWLIAGLRLTRLSLLRSQEVTVD